MAGATGAMNGMGAGGGIGEAAGALIGELLANGQREQAMAIARDIVRRYGNVALPEIQKLLPEMQGDTALAGVRADDRYTSVEDEALARMMDYSRSGMNAQDEANLMRARVEAQGQATGAMGQIERDARRRGLNGGSTAQMRAIAAQQGANRLYQGGVQAAGDASQRALQSLQMGSQYASSLAGRDLGQKNLVGQSRDRIAQFNLGRKDDAARINQGIPQQQFNNQMQKLDGQTAGLKLLIDQYGEQANSTRRAARAGGGMVGSAVGGIAGGM